MIIKSMSRKNPSFSQLFDYLNRERDDSYPVLWNLNLATPALRPDVLSLFESNAQLLQRSRGSNLLYHEVLSLKRTGRNSTEELKTALYGLSLEYLRCRAPNLLAYGRVHLAEGHVHLHLMLSANEMGEAKRFRLSRSQFCGIQQHCERFLACHFPHLENESVYSNRGGKGPDRITNAEFQLQRRGRQASQREVVRALVASLLAEEIRHTTAPLAERLKSVGFELYERGCRSHGVVSQDDGKRYRFSTLGLLDDFLIVRSREQKIALSKQQLTRFYASQPQCEPGLDGSPDFLTAF